VELPDPALLVERTEGWAAALRLAALSLAAHPDPDRFAAEFSGTERTVAEYLLAEVLDRQGEQVRRLLLRTSVLDRVNGELADLLTGDSGGERMLQDLEAANAFTVALDAARSWFRYHHMFAALLRLELRRAAPGEVAGLHRAAAGWLAEHGYPVEAVRHARAAREWPLAARLLTGHWPGLYLDGQAGTVHELLAGFPAEATAADAELAAVAAADELAYGSLEAAERYLGSAERGSASVPDARHGQAQVLLGIVRLLAARQRGNLPAVTDEARRLQAMAEAPEAAQYDLAPATRAALGEDLHALALISLGEAEYWTARFEDANRHLERGIALARRIGRPYLEFTGLAHQAAAQLHRSYAQAAEHGRQAVELAERHGWTDDPALGVASTILGLVLAGQARPDEAEAWVQRAERTITAEAAHPAMLAGIRHARGAIELARYHDAEALAALEAAEQLARWLAAPHYLIARTRSLLLHSLLRLGQTDRAWMFLAGLSGEERGRGEIRVAAAEVELARDNPNAALAELAALQQGPGSGDLWGFWQVRAGVLEAIARDALGDQDAAETALERALDLAEPYGVLTPFLWYPVPGRLLERRARHGTAHAALVADILSLLAGRKLAPPAAGPQPPLETLSDSEVRVLRYLPTNLSMRQIASELYVSHNTVRTHISHLYAKLGTHTRAEAVARARGLGLLAPSPLGAKATRAG
jgi:LuxR family transcriptional regulator, maltose regulon positive regulatory protein